MKPPVYLDNAATTPVRREVLEAMLPYLTDQTFGNPSSAHRWGRAAKAGVEEARQKVANALGVKTTEVLFTSGGTEADNLTVIGPALAAREQGRPLRVGVTSIEHKAVLAAAHAVERMGGEAVIVPVDARGLVEAEALEQALAAGLSVLSTMWVNNEVGTIQDVHAIGERCRCSNTTYHIDAVQALGKLDCSIANLPCTLLSISGHKIGAPKGIGAVIVRDRKVLKAIIHGGSQQYGLRPGTENVPGIVALGRAVELAVAEQPETARHTGALRDELERRVLELIPDTIINGAAGPRAPHVSNLSIPGTDSESMLMHLDLAGIACSSGSACSTGAIEPSHVLTAMGVPRDLAIAALRFSFSKATTAADIERVAEELPKVTAKVRKLAGVLGR